MDYIKLHEKIEEILIYVMYYSKFGEQKERQYDLESWQSKATQFYQEDPQFRSLVKLTVCYIINLIQETK